MGRKEMGAGHYRSAKRYFEKASHATPGDPIPLANLAQACFALGEYRHAGQLLQQVVTSLPDSADSWHLLGQVLFRSHQYGPAQDAFRRALSLNQDALIWSDLAALSVVQHRDDEALDRYRLAIRGAGPGQGRARVRGNLAQLQWKRGARDAAASGYLQALDEMTAAVGPDHPEIAILLEQYSTVLRGLGRKREAQVASARATAIRQRFASQMQPERFVVDVRDLR
jgi:tetratricopeptide (TPR) repeat protein